MAVSNTTLASARAHVLAVMARSPSISATNTMTENFDVLLSDQYLHTTLRRLEGMTKKLRKDAAKDAETAWKNLDDNAFLRDLDSLAIRHAIITNTVNFRQGAPVEFPGDGLKYDSWAINEVALLLHKYFREYVIRWHLAGSPYVRPLHASIKGFVNDGYDFPGSYRHREYADVISEYRGMRSADPLAAMIVQVHEAGFDEQLLPSSIIRRVIYGALEAINEKMDEPYNSIRVGISYKMHIIAAEIAFGSWRIGGDWGARVISDTPPPSDTDEDESRNEDEATEDAYESEGWHKSDDEDKNEAEDEIKVEIQNTDEDQDEDKG